MQPLNTTPKILLIDDDPNMVPLVQGLLNGSAHVVVARTLQQGMQLASELRIDAILLDHLLPDGAGLNHIERLVSADRLRPILFVTAQSDASTAIEATKRGAFDYFSKPVDFSFLKQRIAEALEYRQLTRTPVVVGLANEGKGDVLVGRCRAMQDVYKAVGRMAAVRNPVLIEGEPGTGKELIARTIHQFGSDRDKPFNKWSVADQGEATIPSKLFAIENQFATSSTPPQTLLVEDVDQLPLSTQSRLLNLLRYRSEAGGEEPVRWIFTASQPSRVLVEQGKMRSDLYYLLNSTAIHVPALRNRDGDLEILVSHFVQRMIQVESMDNGSPSRVSAEAMLLMRQYEWPGNVTELKSVLERVLLESRGAILATDTLRQILKSAAQQSNSTTQVQDSSRATSAAQVPRALISTRALNYAAEKGSFDLVDFVQQQLTMGSTTLYEDCVAKLEESLLPLVLHRTKGNRAAAARILGMTRTSLRRKMQQLNLGSSEDLSELSEGKDADDLPGED